MSEKLPFRVRMKNLKSKLLSKLLLRTLLAQLREQVTAKALLFLGKLFEILYRFPLIGEPLVRRLARSLGRMAFYSPMMGLKKRESIKETKKDFLRVAEKLGFLVEMSGEKTDQFEFFILSCPLGYYRAEQQGLCDAAMDLDRTMTRLCGAELAVK